MTLVKYSWNPVEDNIMAEYDGAGNLLARYTTEPERYGNVISQNRNGQTSYFHHDGIGNTTAVTNDDGDVTDTRAYTAFGEITESTGTTEFPFQYVGQKGYYRDKETGEYSVRRRPYESVIARWKSFDPIGAHDSINGYQYASNQASILIDPSGLLSVIELEGNTQNIDCDESIVHRYKYWIDDPGAPCDGYFGFFTEFSGAPRISWGIRFMLSA